MAEKSRLRVIFAGTPTFAAQHLQALIDSPHQIAAVYTQPDRPAGRGKKLRPSPVKELALQNGLEVLQPTSLKSDAVQAQLRGLNADIMVVVAYGLILPAAVLAAPRLGCINVHASLLPRWRGAAPIQRAIEAGDKETGVTIMQMDAGLDTGPMLLTTTCPIEPEDTTQSLLEKLATQGGPALLSVLDQAANNRLQAEPQDDSLACYANKIEKSEARIDWSLSAVNLQRKIHAFNPVPVAFTELKDQRIKIYRVHVVKHVQPHTPGEIIANGGDTIVVACGEQALAIEALQLPGKKVLSSADVLRGHLQLFFPGARFN